MFTAFRGNLDAQVKIYQLIDTFHLLADWSHVIIHEALLNSTAT